MSAGCPHLRVWRGDCCECGEQMGWSDTSNVTDAEGRTRRALRHVSWRIAARRWENR